MKGKIDKLGVLHINRKGEFNTAYCKYSEGTVCSQCCAHFGEPIESDITLHINLEICDGKKLIFDEFTDEREVA